MFCRLLFKHAALGAEITGAAHAHPLWMMRLMTDTADVSVHSLFELPPVAARDTCFPGKSADGAHVRVGHGRGGGSSQGRESAEGTAATFPRRWRNAREGSDDRPAHERAATFTSVLHISFSLLSGTIARRVKGEGFDVEKMKNPLQGSA